VWRSRAKLSSEIRHFKKIIVAVDGSENSKRAAVTAVEIAEKYRAELDVLHVVPRLDYDFTQLSITRRAVPPTAFGQVYDEARKEAEKYVDDIVSGAQAKGVLSKGEVLEDKPSIVEAIIEYAKNKKADLIVTGTRGQGGFKKLLVGSVSSGVLAHAECPVLIVK
jgi:nucleotide-binding universal stress UspA family protein